MLSARGKKVLVKRYLHFAAIYPHPVVQEGSESFEPLLPDGRSFSTFHVAEEIRGGGGRQVVQIIKSFVLETRKRRGQTHFQIQQERRQYDAV